MSAFPQRENRQEALRTIASLIEEHMSELGLSEDEKDERVDSFSRHVDDAVHAKS